ncbi:MAG: zinc metallopeptidase [Clostridia bacterium]|nr:zinc metallopeptidase [Clostridia bacterium]
MGISLYFLGLAFLPALIVAIIASIKVMVVIERYQHVKASGGITASDLVHQIAQENQLNIRVEVASEQMGDHYDPTAKVVRLTEKVINSDSVSALAIAAHECGHAMQDAENYAPLRLRNFVIRLSNFSSRLLTPLIIISLIASILTFGMASEIYFQWLLLGFCVVYGLSALVSLITLPTEFDASRRGKKMLESMQVISGGKERRQVSRVLRAAANTYVVSFALSLLYFLRFLSYFMLLRRKD